MASALDIEKKLKCRGLERVEGVDNMWKTTSSCIRETAREVLGVSRGLSDKYRGDDGGTKRPKKGRI